MNIKYYIYEIPGIKIGCTINPYFRIEIGQKYKEYKILETHQCIYKASDREIELQKEYGYPVDIVPYYKISNWQRQSSSPDIRKKAAKGISKACKGGKKPNVSRKKKGVFMPWLNTEEVISKRVSNTDQISKGIKISKIKKGIPNYKLYKSVLQYNKEEVFLNRFESIKEASLYTGVNRCTISDVLNNRTKTGKGFIWKYE